MYGGLTGRRASPRTAAGALRGFGGGGVGAGLGAPDRAGPVDLA